MIYTVTLNPALDYIVSLPQFDTGKINRSEKAQIEPGGKGINVSLLLKELQVDSIALGFAAGHTGQMLFQLLEQKQLKTDFLFLQSGETRINVKIKSRTETELNATGPIVTGIAYKALLEKVKQTNQKDTLVLAGSVPQGLPEDVYEQLAKETKAQIVADTTGKQLLGLLQYRPFVIKPNRVELEELFCEVLDTDDKLQRCANQLQMKGARNVLVSLAGDGALLLDETGRVHRAHATKGTVQNSAGAGDSMLAGFLAGWQKSGSYEESLQWGIAAGSATAFSTGIASYDAIIKLKGE